jgi:hypothetical protein
LESLLYDPLRKKAVGTPIERHLITVLNNPMMAEKNQIAAVCEFFEVNYGASSLLGVVRFLLRSASLQKNPYVIITFNADTFLETLVYLFERRDHYRGPGPYGHPLFHYVPILRPANMARFRAKGRSSIFHCHGTIMPHRGATNPKDSRDRLVFLEQEYLPIASTSASWPETLFLFHAQTSRMIFMGLSMSDANVRRWMSASETEVSQDHDHIFVGKRINPEHLWITTRPTDPALERIKLVAMLHLGIRPAWIDDWAELEYALDNLLAI